MESTPDQEDSLMAAGLQKLSKSIKAQKSSKQNKSRNNATRKYRFYSDNELENFFKVYAESMGSIREAAKRSLINYSTAKSWVRKYEKDPTRLPDVGRSGGRSECQLDEEDKELVRQIVADCPDKQTSNVMKDLEDRMAELDIDQIAVKRFITAECGFSMHIVKPDQEMMCGAYPSLQGGALAMLLTNCSAHYQQNCVFLSRAEFTCYRRKRGGVRKWSLALLAALHPDGQTFVELDPMAIEREHGTYVAKESHKIFVSKTLDRFVKEREGRGGFAIMDRDFAQEIPDIDILCETRKCALFDVPRGSLKFNPVNNIWPILVETISGEEFKGKETFKSRLQSTMASIQRAHFRAVIQDCVDQLELCSRQMTH